MNKTEIEKHLEELKDCEKIDFVMFEGTHKTVYKNTVVNNSQQKAILGSCVEECATACMPYEAIIEINAHH